MNIIFLDFDGVLNNLTCGHRNEQIQLNQKLMLRVADLARDTKSQIVISSTWRLGNSLLYFQEIFWHFTNLISFGKHECGYYQPNWYESKSHVIGKTPRFGGLIRGYEIEYWLTAHEGFVSNYVILDDDSDMLPHQMSHFVKINSWYGITKKDVNKAKDILNDRTI